MLTEDWLKRDSESLSGVLPRVTEIVAESGAGSWLWDVDGNKYLDFSSGIGALSTGHRHRDVVEAIKRQAERLIHTSVVTHNLPTVELAERLAETTPWLEDPQVFFCNSGAEAVDGSLKLARRVTGQAGVISFEGAFHGRTVNATSLTRTKGLYRKGYQMLPWHYGAPWNSNIEVLEEMLQTGPPKWPYRIGAVIVEPVQGEGGYRAAGLWWLQDVRDLCDKYGALLIFDEVQTGVWRTGRMWAAEHYSVKPDVLLFAKGVASGMPLGGIIASRETMEKWGEPGSHGSTFGGNPVSCAAGLATLDVLESMSPNTIEELGKHAVERLKAAGLFARGLGLMIGVGFRNAEEAETVRVRCLNQGLLVLTCGIHGEVVRLIPPLTVSFEELTLGLNIFLDAVGEVWTG